MSTIWERATASGENIRYLVRDRFGRPIACALFSSLFLLGGRRRSRISAGRTELAVGQFLEAFHLDR